MDQDFIFEALLNATSELEAFAILVKNAVAALSGDATLAATFILIEPFASDISATSQALAHLTTILGVNADLSATSNMVSDVGLTQGVSALLDPSSTLSTDVIRVLNANASLSGEATAMASMMLQHGIASIISGNATLSADTILTFGPTAWYIAEPAYLVRTGTVVDTWLDASLNGYDMVRTGNDANYVAGGGPNSTDTVRYELTDASSVTFTSTKPSYAGTSYIYIVAKVGYYSMGNVGNRVVNSGVRLFVTPAAAWPLAQHDSEKFSNNALQYRNLGLMPFQTGYNTNVNSLHYINYRFVGKSLSTTIGSAWLTGDTYIGGWGNPSYQGTTEVAEAILFEKTISAEQHADIIDYLETKYGLTNFV